MESRPLILAVIDAFLLLELCGEDEIDGETAARATESICANLMRLRHDDQVELREQLAEIADDVRGSDVPRGGRRHRRPGRPGPPPTPTITAPGASPPKTQLILELVSASTVCRANNSRINFGTKVAVMHGYLGSYATLGLLLIVGALVFVGAFGANRLLRPSNPANPPGKRATYESGVDPVGTGWAQVQIRYYIYAFLYVLFAVESVFLFPWATIYAKPGFRHVGRGRDGRVRRCTRARPALCVAEKSPSLDVTGDAGLALRGVPMPRSTLWLTSSYLCWARSSSARSHTVSPGSSRATTVASIRKSRTAVRCRCPSTRPLTETDIETIRFDTTLRGYRMDQVDAALRRAAYDLGYKEELIEVLEAEISAVREGRDEEAEVLRVAREGSSPTGRPAVVSDLRLESGATDRAADELDADATEIDAERPMTEPMTRTTS